MMAAKKTSAKSPRFRWSRTIPADETESWETRFFLLGHTNVVFTGKPGKRETIEAYFFSKSEAEAFEKQFGGSIESFQDQNWAALSKSGSAGKSIRIRDRFVVALDDDPKFLSQLQKEFPNRHILEFPPDMAFGTGDHATTATCLRMLSDLRQSLPNGDWTFLDLGTGTGILAVAACRLGAKQVVATDFDPKAVEIAKSSLVRHHLDESQVAVIEQDALSWRPSQRFDVVAANIFSDTLIQVMPKIRRSVKKAGFVVLSGILREQAANVEAAAEKNGLALQRKVTRGKWVSLLARAA
tara:strand:- start:7552 stop:8442 length:891 start_codon:yes stop_codon:yes gene_type:complete